MKQKNYQVELRNLKSSVDLFQAMPKSMLIYNLAKAIQIPDFSHKDEIDYDELTHMFSQCLTATFPLQGELTGYAVSIIDESSDYYISEEQTEVRDLFIESSNILLGNFLTKLDSDYGLFSHCGAPIVHKSNRFIEKQEAIRKNRILNLLLKTYHGFVIKKFKYDLHYNSKVYPMSLFLLIDIKTAHREE